MESCAGCKLLFGRWNRPRSNITTDVEWGLPLSRGTLSEPRAQYYITHLNQLKYHNISTSHIVFIEGLQLFVFFEGASPGLRSSYSVFQFAFLGNLSVIWVLFWGDQNGVVCARSSCWLSIVILHLYRTSSLQGVSWTVPLRCPCHPSYWIPMA